MTVQPVAIIDKGSLAFPNVIQGSWTAMLNGDSGAPIAYPQFNDKSIHVKGTFGTGGTILIEGSNDGVTYKTLKDAQGTDLSFTAEAVKQVAENPLWIRPRVSAGDGTTSLSCFIVGTKGSR